MKLREWLQVFHAVLDAALASGVLPPKVEAVLEVVDGVAETVNRIDGSLASAQAHAGGMR